MFHFLVAVLLRATCSQSLLITVNHQVIFWLNLLVCLPRHMAFLLGVLVLRADEYHILIPLRCPKFKTWASQAFVKSISGREICKLFSKSIFLTENLLSEETILLGKKLVHFFVCSGKGISGSVYFFWDINKANISASCPWKFSIFNCGKMSFFYLCLIVKLWCLL